MHRKYGDMQSLSSLWLHTKTTVGACVTLKWCISSAETIQGYVLVLLLDPCYNVDNMIPGLFSGNLLLAQGRGSRTLSYSGGR